MDRQLPRQIPPNLLGSKEWHMASDPLKNNRQWGDAGTQVISGFLSRLVLIHGTLQSPTCDEVLDQPLVTCAICYRNTSEALPFRYFSHTSGCCVQRENRSRNPNTTVSLPELLVETVCAPWRCWGNKMLELCRVSRAFTGHRCDFTTTSHTDRQTEIRRGKKPTT